MTGNFMDLVHMVTEGRDPNDLVLRMVVGSTKRTGVEEEAPQQKSIYNFADTSVQKAREIAEKWYEGAGKDLDKDLPDFEENYLKIQRKVRKESRPVNRLDMPVIEPEDIKKFEERLKTGSVDLFAPFAKGKATFPKSVLAPGSEESDEWLSLGFKDGKKEDDRVKAQVKMVQVGKLKPTQDQVWLGKTVPNIIEYGPARSGSDLLVNRTIIVSKEGYLLDGHHRWSQAMMVDPGLTMKALWIPLDLDFLLKMGKGYSYAIGRRPKA